MQDWVEPHIREQFVLVKFSFIAPFSVIMPRLAEL
jgi:hypothetical protein